MTKKELACQAVAALKEEYPGAVCSLEYQDPLQLLIAVRLSAQCTDARVNLVTPGLFARFPTLEAFCEGTEEEIGELIRSCGFYNTKSKDILGMCKMIRDEFGGKVPDTIEELTRLPGVGRKTANLIEKCCMAAFCKKKGVGPNGEKLPSGKQAAKKRK